jgi:molybdopterin synthase catalytic subunit
VVDPCPILVRVQRGPFSVGNECERLRKFRTDIGALVTFTGLVRDFDDGKKLKSLTLEHYPAMTQTMLETLAADAAARWPLLGLTVIHRFGDLKPGDDIVLVCVASAHRQAAFDAANFLMDWLKTKAPFWKKEVASDGAKWVEAKAADDVAADKW